MTFSNSEHNLNRFRIAAIALYGMAIMNWWLSGPLFFVAGCIEATLRKIFRHCIFLKMTKAASK